MLFNSPIFIAVFLPLAFLVARPLKGRALLAWLSLASFVFYAFAGHVWFLVPMACTITFDYFIARKIEESPDPRLRKFLLVLSLTTTLSLLAYLKYAGFFFANGDAVARAVFGSGLPESWRKAFSVLLPAGISFYSFQAIAYVVDVYMGRCKAERDFFRFSTFIAFFPHLVAGPLTRHDQLIPQLAEIAEKGMRPRWEAGVYLFVLGLAKKMLIADRVGNLVDLLLLQPSALDAYAAWLAMAGFTVQLYFDFSGYSDMAIGLGRLFGVEFPQNFDRPYTALNPSDFWRRWHITLSRFLRDYLYIPLGGNRAGPARQRVNLMITMLLGGLWHGAGWTFVAWGAYHGALLVVYQATEKSWDRLPRLLQGAAMFLLVMLGWVLFRAPTLEVAGQWYLALCGLGAGVDPLGLAVRPEPLRALWVLAGLSVVWGLPNASRYERFEDLGPLPQAALGALAVLSLLMMNYTSKFLYFQF